MSSSSSSRETSIVESKTITADPALPRDRKSGLSCAECRRSKLKCDRLFPCQSCIRRGCSGICPNGTLAATKGNKVLMAHAQRLAEEVKVQAARIKELEEALSQAQPTVGDNPHPLLQEIALKDPSQCNTDHDSIYNADVREISAAIGSLAIGSNGEVKYHGESASSEYFNKFLGAQGNNNWRKEEQKLLGLPFELADLVNAFPFGLADCPYMRYTFISYVPPREKALELTELYYKNSAWMHDPIPRTDFMNTIFNLIYGSTGPPSLDSINAHSISVFFILLATGSLFISDASASFTAEKYHALSRAAFSLDPFDQEACCATVQALFMIIWYMYSCDRSNNEYRWLLMGLCSRVAQIIGLQRDSAGWDLEEEEIQRRRLLFWEIFTYDAWSGLVNGRPPSLSIQQTDCRFPDDLEPVMKTSGEVEMGWHAWKFRYSAACLTISSQHVFTTRVPSYAAVLELDKKIRKFPLPSHLQSPVQASEVGRAWSSDPHKAMQQYVIVCERESNLLYIHRSYFVQAIRESPQNPLTHKFAPSVLATYRSACRLICSLRGVYQIHPSLTSKVWFFWTGIFSSCIILGALVVESPGSTLATNALHEFDSTIAFYEEGSSPCRPPSTINALHKLQQRAHDAYASYQAGLPRSAHHNTHCRKNPDVPDELEVLGGCKTVITTKSASNSPESQNIPSPQSAGAATQLIFSDSPASDDAMQSRSYGETNPVLMDYYESLNNPSYDSLERAGFEMSSISAEKYASPLSTTSESPQPPPQPQQQVYLPPQTAALPNRSGGAGFTHSHLTRPQFMQQQHGTAGYPVQAQHLMQPVIGHEQNQEQIWQDFVQHLGLGHS